MEEQNEKKEIETFMQKLRPKPRMSGIRQKRNGII